MVALVPTLLRQELARLAEADARLDGRGQWEGRQITLETDCLYNGEGSAKVVMGDTIIYAGVKFEMRTPWPDRPNEGSLMCSAELRPIAGRKYEPGPPSPESIELSRVVDRGIRESGCIDMEKLCDSLYFLSNNPLIIPQRSFLKKKMVLKAVAVCRTMVKSIFSSSERLFILKNISLNISKCPLDEIGRNSVKPCTIPKRIDSM